MEFTRSNCESIVDSIESGATTVRLCFRVISLDNLKFVLSAVGDVDSKVQELNLVAIRLTDEMVQDIADNMTTCSSLCSLNVEQNQISVAGAQHLAVVIENCPNLRELNVANNQIGSHGIDIILDTIKNRRPEDGRSVIERLDLSQCSSGQHGYESIAAGLDNGALSFLSELRLNYCSIDAELVQNLRRGLIGRNNLSVLTLRGNRIGDEGVCELFRLDERIRVKEIHLDCAQIGDKGIGYICEFLKDDTKLSTLRLSRNNISDDGIGKLVEVIRNSNRTLMSINVSWNKIGIAGAEYISELIRSKMGCFHRFEFSANDDMGQQGLAMIQHSVNKFESFCYCSLTKEQKLAFAMGNDQDSSSPVKILPRKLIKKILSMPVRQARHCFDGSLIYSVVRPELSVFTQKI